MQIMHNLIEIHLPIFKIQFCANTFPRVYWVQVLGDQNWTYVMICNGSMHLLSLVSDTGSYERLVFF